MSKFTDQVAPVYDTYVVNEIIRRLMPNLGEMKSLWNVLGELTGKTLQLSVAPKLDMSRRIISFTP